MNKLYINLEYNNLPLIIPTNSTELFTMIHPESLTPSYTSYTVVFSSLPPLAKVSRIFHFTETTSNFLLPLSSEFPDIQLGFIECMQGSINGGCPSNPPHRYFRSQD